jgi:hypothetical protein
MTELTTDRPHSTIDKTHTKIVSSQNLVFMNNFVGFNHSIKSVRTAHIQIRCPYAQKSSTS